MLDEAHAHTAGQEAKAKAQSTAQGKRREAKVSSEAGHEVVAQTETKIHLEATKKGGGGTWPLKPRDPDSTAGCTPPGSEVTKGGKKATTTKVASTKVHK
jgi:hypothetical protein